MWVVIRDLYHVKTRTPHYQKTNGEMSLERV